MKCVYIPLSPELKLCIWKNIAYRTTSDGLGLKLGLEVDLEVGLVFKPSRKREPEAFTSMDLKLGLRYDKVEPSPFLM
jgi:hypothetical protein